MTILQYSHLLFQLFLGILLLCLPFVQSLLYPVKLQLQMCVFPCTQMRYSGQMIHVVNASNWLCRHDYSCQ